MKITKKLCVLAGALLFSHSAMAVDQNDIAGFSTDSCSKPWFVGFTQWSGWGGVCRVHDWHYARMGVDRAWADSKFKSNLKKRCSSKYKWYDPRRPLCRETADLWYHAVRSPGNAYYTPTQNRTKSNVLAWIGNSSNTASKAITTTAVEPDFRYPDQPFYIHLVDKKYVDVLQRASAARSGNTSNTQKWQLLADAFHKGKDNFYGWKNNALTQLEVKQCWNGSYLAQSETCPIYEEPDYCKNAKPWDNCQIP